MSRRRSVPVEQPPTAGTVRIDKWLWAARFYKTRALASEAISGGHVQVDGNRVKPARLLRVGETVTIRKGQIEWQVVVRALSVRRGPAAEARELYDETEASRQHREERDEQRRLLADSAPHPEKRPDKRARRRIIQFRDR